MTRISYPRPPITEAVVDFRFPARVTGEQLLVAIHGALGSQFSGERKPQELLEFEATVSAAGVTTAARKGLHLTFLRSDDGLRLVGCGNGMLSVHVLAPYPGWEVFLEQVRAVVAAASPLLSETGLHQIAVRYLDRIVVPVAEGATFNGCFTVFPSRPAPMPENLLGFQHVTQTVDPADGTRASMMIASAPSELGSPVVLYDLTVWRVGAPLSAAVEFEWLPIVEQLHDRQCKIFEGSITEELRRTFK